MSVFPSVHRPTEGRDGSWLIILNPVIENIKNLLNYIDGVIIVYKTNNAVPALLKLHIYLWPISLEFFLLGIKEHIFTMSVLPHSPLEPPERNVALSLPSFYPSEICVRLLTYRAVR